MRPAVPIAGRVVAVQHARFAASGASSSALRWRGSRPPTPLVVLSEHASLQCRGCAAAAGAFRRPPRASSTTATSARRVSTATTGEGPIDATRQKHRELQSLLRGDNDKDVGGSSSLPSMADHQQQRRRQSAWRAVVNAALSVFVVTLAAQSVKNKHERRQAQELQQRTEEDLKEVRRILRSLLSDEELRNAARDCLRAVSAFDRTPPPWWMTWGRRASARETETVNDHPDDAVERVARVLCDHLRSRIGPAMLDPENLEALAVRQLVAGGASDGGAPVAAAVGEAAGTLGGSSANGSGTGEAQPAPSKPKSAFLM